jgi:hypothetical protein
MDGESVWIATSQTLGFFGTPSYSSGLDRRMSDKSFGNVVSMSTHLNFQIALECLLAMFPFVLYF